MRKARGVISWLLVFWYMRMIFYGSSLTEDKTPLAWGISDKLLHSLEYGGLCLLVLTALWLTTHVSLKKCILIAVAWCVLFGFSDEIHQLWTPTRHYDYFDMMADASGAMLASYLFMGAVWLEKSL